MAYSTVKYVNPESGLDSNNGSVLAPYKTLDKADQVATPSTKVYLRGGTYREYFEPTTSGASGTDNDIAYEAYPGEEPLFLGDPNTTPIVKLTGTISHITLRGIRSRWGYDTAPNNDYKYALWQLDGANVQHILVDRVTLERQGYDNLAALYSAKWNEYGISFINAKYCEMKNSIVRGVKRGVHLQDEVKEIWVHNNNLGPIVFSPIVINGGNFTWKDVLISFNDIWGSYSEDGIQGQPDNIQLEKAPTTNWGVVVYGNNIFDCNENAIDLKGCRYWLIEGNYIWGIKGSNNGPVGGWDKAGYAIMRGANHDAFDIIVRNNAIWDCAGGIGIRGDGWKVYNNAVLYNNSNYLGPNQSYGDLTFLGIMNVEGKSDVGVKNNIAYGTEGCDIGARMTNFGSSGDMDLDYNLGLTWLDRVYPGTGGTRYTYLSVRDAIAATGWNTEGEAHNKTGSWADIAFDGLPQRPVGPQPRSNFRIKTTSIAYQAGGWQTLANGSGSSSVTLVVDDARYFKADMTLRTGDKIFFNGQERRCTAINYGTNTITLDAAATWSNNAPIYLGASATPNMGPSAPLGAAGIDGTDEGGGGGEPPPEPPPSGGGGPGFVGLGFAAANTSTGNQTIPIVSPNGDAPVATEFFVTYGVTDGASADVAALSIGAAVDASNQFAFCCRSNHGSADSYTHRQGITNGCILVYNSSTTADYARAAFVSADENGVTINWSVAPSAALLVAVRAYYAEDAFVDMIAINSTVDQAASVAPGFKPNLMRVTGNGREPGGFTNGRLGYGTATVTNDVVTQNVVGWATQNAQAAANPLRLMVNGRISVVSSLTGGSISWATEITDLLDTTFNLRTRDGTPGDAEEVGVLCVRFQADVWSGIIDIPATATGTPYTSVGWRPAYLDMVATYLTGLGAGDTGHNGGAAGVGSYMDDDAGTRWSVAVAEEDAAATMNTESRVDSSRFLSIPTDAGSDTNAIRADDVVMLDNGFQINWVTTPGTSVRKAIAFAVRSTQGITPAFEADVLSGTAPLTVTFTNLTTAEGLTVPDDITWAWDFGDGDTSTDYEPEHIYDVAGVYTVTLTASAGSLEEVYALENYIVVESAVNIGAAALGGHGAALIADVATESGFGTALIAPPPDAPGFGGALLS